MSEPHESVEAFNLRATAFQDELRVLREKHRMRDVLLVIGGSALNEDGDELEFIVHGHIGDPLRAETMAAYALGATRKDHETLIARALKR